MSHEHWDAEAWVDCIRSGEHGHPHDAAIRELLPPPDGLTLDVGCGEGRWVRELAGRGYDVVGVDPSEPLLEKARAADPGGRYLQADAAALPFAGGTARLVLCVNVLMHVVDVEPAVAELARVLGRGGVLVVGLTHPVMEAGTFDDERDELRLSGYFAHEEHALPLGEGHVFHQHRTIEQYIRSFLGAGFALDDLREVPGRTGSVPRYLDLRFTYARPL